MLDRLFPKDPFIDYSVEAVIETRIEVIDMDWARCKYPAGHPANIQSTAQILGPAEREVLDSGLSGFQNLNVGFRRAGSLRQWETRLHSRL